MVICPWISSFGIVKFPLQTNPVSLLLLRRQPIKKFFSSIIQQSLIPYISWGYFWNKTQIHSTFQKHFVRDTWSTALAEQACGMTRCLCSLQKLLIYRTKLMQNASQSIETLSQRWYLLCKETKMGKISNVMKTILIIIIIGVTPTWRWSVKKIKQLKQNRKKSHFPVSGAVLMF